QLVIELARALTAKDSKLPHVREGMYICPVCGDRFYDQGSVKQCHGLGGHALRGRVTDNTKDWQFNTDHAKLKLFQQWIAQQLLSNIIGLSQEQLWNKYIEEGYKKGAGRAFDETRPQVKAAMKHEPDAVSDFYKGTKYEFLRSAFGQPI